MLRMHTRRNFLGVSLRAATDPSANASLVTPLPFLLLTHMIQPTTPTLFGWNNYSNSSAAVVGVVFVVFGIDTRHKTAN